MKKTIICFLIISGTCCGVFAGRLLVPQQFSTIQAAINAAQPADTVLVSPGVYYENINFRAKSIVLASMYIFSHDTATIDSTVINGSQPSNADSASCVIIASKSPSTALDTGAVLIGFRITGGTGTKWNDEHNPGYIYREGGGILIQYLSPRILHNHITGNSATNTSGGMASAGGGAIRCGDANPLIQNNVIDNNHGRYGAGIVFNYCGGIIRNNLIAHNTGGQDYGGSGLWILGVNAQATPRIVTNNTIIYNFSGGPGGGVRAWNTDLVLTNNILWGNTGTNGPQIYASPNPATARYNDIQGGYNGQGNISQDPEFDIPDYYLSSNSPCIDKGDSTIDYNDIPDPQNPGHALFPSRGSLRNDMGAYGGPYCSLLSSLSTVWTGSGSELNFFPEIQIRVIPNPVRNEAEIILGHVIHNQVSSELIDMSGRSFLLPSPEYYTRDECGIHFSRNGLHAGSYCFLLKSGKEVIAMKTLIID